MGWIAEVIIPVWGAVWVSVVSIAVAGCATAAVTPDWRVVGERVAKEEAMLLERVKVYDDRRLSEYLAEVVGRLLGPSGAGGEAAGVGIVVLEDPTLDAFALPGGRLFVHSGLLGVVESETQLATILARELARRADRDALPWPPSAWEGPLPRTVLSPTAAVIFGRDLRLVAWAAITGSGPGAERAIDRETLRRLGAAGYDAREAPEAFRLLARDDAARGPLEIFRYGSRLRMRERYETTRELVGRDGAGPEAAERATSDGRFEAVMRPLVRDNAALDARAGRFELARRGLERVLAVSPDDPVVQLRYGDLHRLRAQHAEDATERAADEARARAHYERAVELDPTYPAPFRQLGLLYFETKATARAREAFARYLALAPDAPDAPRVREYLATLHD